MIFYHPAPVKENADSASGIRPRKMLEAFRNLGLEIDEVSGHNAERAGAIAKIKSHFEKGVRYAFAYGENTTLPFAFNNPSHIPLRPFQDYLFWGWMKKKDIPFGCFYRDIYWRFPELRKGLSFYKWAAPLPFHYMDVLFLNKLTTRLFLPSLEASDLLPGHWDRSKFVALPPGCEDVPYQDKTRYDQTLRFFYVGGVKQPNYDLSPMLEFFSKTERDVCLTICCREKEWEETVSTGIIGKIPKEKITVCHGKGKVLEPLWAQADLFLALWGGTPYRNFAMPFKIFEAIKYGKPIITTKGTAAGDFVEQNGFGWALTPESDALEKLVWDLRINPEKILEKRKKILESRRYHTWAVRARQVVKALCGKDIA